MSRTEKLKLDWEYFFETGKVLFEATTYVKECGCTRNKRYYKRQDRKRARREGKALVCFEATYPDVEKGEPREVLQDRRGYTSVDYWYFENFIMADWFAAHDLHRHYDEQLSPDGQYTSQSEGY